jgi:hypothetical protein
VYRPYRSVYRYRGSAVRHSGSVGRTLVAIALSHFSAENNKFSGEIPINLGYGMPLRQHLNLASDNLSGRIH